jgi:hypothetical protein
MTSVTGSPGKSVLVSGLALVLLLGGAACTGDEESSGDAQGGGSSSSGATDAPQVETLTTLQHVGNSINSSQRAKVKAAVNELIDPWFEGAFLGDFPRSDYAGAFAGFSEGAASDAQGRDLAVLSNQAIADQIDSATAVNRRVRVDLFAHDGHPRGATAHFVLDFDTTGGLEERRRVHGDLYLARDRGEWKIFGYDVDEPVTL